MTQIKLKVCGVQTAEEARMLVEAGVDLVGLNFVPTSTRCISLETAQSIMTVLEGSPTQSVALFQNQLLETVKDSAKQLKIDFVQLHGNESADYVQQIAFPVIKAIAIDGNSSFESIKKHISDVTADFYLLDRAMQGKGPLVNLGIAQQVIDSMPGKIYLAGGLTPDNLADIVQQVRPYGIDIAGGVRTDNVLDASKVSACLNILKG